MGDVSHSEEEDTQHLQMKQRKQRNIQEQEKMFNYNVERKKMAFSFEGQISDLYTRIWGSLIHLYTGFCVHTHKTGKIMQRIYLKPQKLLASKTPVHHVHENGRRSIS